MEIPCPLVLIFGKNDRGNAFERTILLKEGYPQLELHILDNCNHIVRWDAMEPFHSLVAKFLPN